METNEYKRGSANRQTADHMMVQAVEVANHINNDIATLATVLVGALIVIISDVAEAIREGHVNGVSD
jgi:hypothetical protein